MSHPERKILAAYLQGEGAGVAGDHSLVVEEECWGPDGAADHLYGAGVVVAVVWEAAGEGDDEGDPLLAAPGTAGTLGVVAWPWRDVPQDHG